MSGDPVGPAVCRTSVGRAAVFLVALLLCSASMPAVTATGAVDPGHAAVSQVSTPLPSDGETNTTDATNTTNATNTRNATDVRHRNPSQVREEGNVTELESHLSRLLAERLGDSVVQLEQGEYERARQFVGPEYDSILDRYVTVSRERRGESGGQFGEAGRAQREFVDSVAEYREKREEYQAAKRSGDEERARELARDLNEVADRSVTAHDRLVEDYTAIERDTGLNFTTELSRVEMLTEEIETQQEQIRSVEFFTTTLTLETTDEAGSFDDPIVVRGRVQSTNGTPEPFGTATFTVGTRAYDTSVGDDGAFEFAYRPTTVPLGRQTLTVAFVPRNDSVYLGSNATMTATVEQATPTVAIDASPVRTAFGNEYRVTGRLAVDGVPVSGTDAALWIGGTPLNVTRTDESGAVQFTGLLPATVPAGEQTVRLGLSEEGRALAPVVAEEPVVVESTGTVVDLDVDMQALESVWVSGTLTTTEGDIVVHQPVDVRFDGTLVGSAVTDRNGEFETVLWLPPNIGADGLLTVEAAFDGSGKNLDSTRESDTLLLPLRRSGTTERERIGLQSSFAGLLGINPVAIGGGLFATLLSAPLWTGGVAVIGLLVVGVLVYRRRPGSDAAVRAVDGGATVGADGESGTETVAVEELPAVLLDVARDRLAAGEPVEAVEYSYLAARLWFVHARDMPKRGTHRQFLRAADADGSLPDSERARLSEVTTRYEQAAFSPTSPTEEDAFCAIDASASLLS